jgi:hypothetical protein
VEKISQSIEASTQISLSETDSSKISSDKNEIVQQNTLSLESDNMKNYMKLKATQASTTASAHNPISLTSSSPSFKNNEIVKATPRKDIPTPRTVNDKLLTTPRQQREEAIALRELVREANSSKSVNETPKNKDSLQRNFHPLSTLKSDRWDIKDISEVDNTIDSNDNPNDVIKSVNNDPIADYFKKVDSSKGEIILSSRAPLVKEKSKTMSNSSMLSARRVLKEEPVDIKQLSA